MKIRQVRYLLFILLTSILGLIDAEISSTDCSLIHIELSGTDAFRKGDYKAALEQALADSVVKDTVLRLFKLGVINSKLDNQSKALFYFRLAAQKSSLLTPFSFEFIGDIENSLKQPQNALNAYRVVMNTAGANRYRNFVFEKLRHTFETESANLPKGPWLDDYRQWLLPLLKPQIVSDIDTIDSIIALKRWPILDSVLTIALSKDQKLSSIVTLMADTAIPDSIITTTTYFSLAQAAYSCKDYPSAQLFFSKAKSRKDYQKCIPEKNALLFEAKLLNATGSLENALALFKKYEDKFGPDSELLMTIARVYRKLDKDDEAAKWYQKHLKLFPSHQKSQEIIWLMGWRMELLGKYKEASSYYHRIYSTFRDGSRVEEAYLRHALCFFKRDSYDSTIVILNNYIKKFSSSSQIPIAQFWKAKSLLALDQIDSAKQLFKEVSLVEPYDYYANRSRQLLQLLGDTTEYSIDSTIDTLATLRWLDSINPPNAKKALTAADSIALYKGMVLLLVGKIPESDCFLEQLELSFPGNLELQFKLALAYQNENASMQAFRVARRLTWRIPQNSRNTIPFLIYKLLYPTFYADVIQSEATLRNVDPFLVSSVIRQESIFNPSIVSPAGAIGLMQIMPFTGKEVAKRLGESFTVDSLYLPNTNIRYGTSYLRQLLDQFNDNLVLVLAGYNGGPDNVKKWFNHNKEEDFDLFIEDIEFTETRGYVKKVMANYWTYRLLAKNPRYTFGSDAKGALAYKSPGSSISKK